MGYLLILGKGITSIVVLFILSKVMGRKQVSQLNVFDYIIGISIGSILRAFSPSISTYTT